MSFNYAVSAILDEMEDNTEETYRHYSPIPIYSVITNLDSITHKNNFEFRYKQTPGFIENIEHCAKLLQYNNVSINNQLLLITNMIVLLYHQFLLGLNEDASFVAAYWPRMRELYFNWYLPYTKYSRIEDYLSMAQRRHMKGLTYVNKTGMLPNVRRFLNEIAKNETIPEKYIGG